MRLTEFGSTSYRVPGLTWLLPCFLVVSASNQPHSVHSNATYAHCLLPEFKLFALKVCARRGLGAGAFAAKPSQSASAWPSQQPAGPTQKTVLCGEQAVRGQGWGRLRRRWTVDSTVAGMDQGGGGGGVSTGARRVKWTVLLRSL